MKKPRNAQCVSLENEPRCSCAEKYPNLWYCIYHGGRIEDPKKLRRCYGYDGDQIQVRL